MLCTYALARCARRGDEPDRKEPGAHGPGFLLLRGFARNGCAAVRALGRGAAAGTLRPTGRVSVSTARLLSGPGQLVVPDGAVCGGIVRRSNSPRFARYPAAGARGASRRAEAPAGSLRNSRRTIPPHTAPCSLGSRAVRSGLLVRMRGRRAKPEHPRSSSERVEGRVTCLPGNPVAGGSATPRATPHEVLRGRSKP